MATSSISSRGIENAFLSFEFNNRTASWSLTSNQGQEQAIHNARVEARYRTSGGHLREVEFTQKVYPLEPRTIASVHGDLHLLQFSTNPDVNGLRVVVTFSLPDTYPFLLWRLEVTNQGAEPVFIERLGLMKVGPDDLQLTTSQKDIQASNLAFYSNGWQTWSHSATYSGEHRQRFTRLGPLTVPIWYNPGTPRPKTRGCFSSDMFGVLGDRNSRNAILAGFLSQEEHFGSLLADLHHPKPSLSMWANGDNARLDPGQTKVTDWSFLQFIAIDSTDPLGTYIDAVARQNSVNPAELMRCRSPSGWCSWYHFFSNITPEDIHRNLQAAFERRQEIPLDLIQIDDGFVVKAGDWFEFTTAFAKGMEPLAMEIRRAGFEPGLWLAPFIVHARARLASLHPDWLLRGRFNRPVNAGFIWNRFTQALDLTHPDALEYACKVVHTAAQDWGYSYLKLDFLYAAALPGRLHDPTRTRAQVLRSGLRALRAAAGPGITLLGCGCPLGSAIGVVDIMRIGADVDPRWSPSYLGIEWFMRGENNPPSTRNALQNTLTRSPLHRRWWINDPDCLLLRPDTHLTLPEVQTLATAIALSGGSILISDDLAELPPDRFRIAESLFPLMGKTPAVLDWFDHTTPQCVRLDLENATGAWHLLAAFNWKDRQQAITIRLTDFALGFGDYLAREFWSGRIYRIKGDQLTLPEVPAHGVALLAVRPAPGDQPQYLGSDLHVSQGLEVVEWNTSSGELHFRLKRPGRSQGVVVLYLPHSPVHYSLNGEPLLWEAYPDQCYNFKVQIDQEAHLNLLF